MINFDEPIVQYIFATAKVIGRILLVLLGILFLGPNLMMSDSGTPQAQLAALIGGLSSLLLILAGILGNVWLMILGFVTFGVMFKIAYASSNPSIVMLGNVYLYLVLFLALLSILIQFHVISWDQLTWIVRRNNTDQRGNAIQLSEGSYERLHNGSGDDTVKNVLFGVVCK